MDDRACSRLHQHDNDGGLGNWRKDLYESIKEAQKFIYISVPSLNPNISLLLDDPLENKSVSLGELLDEKRREGKLEFIEIMNSYRNNHFL